MSYEEGERVTLAPAQDDSPSIKASTTILPCLFLTAILAAAAVLAGVAGTALSTARFALQPAIAGAAAVPVAAAAAAFSAQPLPDGHAEYTFTDATDATGAGCTLDLVTGGGLEPCYPPHSRPVLLPQGRGS
jgi:hypothetical protein